MNVHDPGRGNKFGEKREGTAIVTSLFHIGCGQTSVKPSNQDEIVKIPVEENDSLRRGSPEGSVPSNHSLCHPVDRSQPPFARKQENERWRYEDGWCGPMLEKREKTATRFDARKHDIREGAGLRGADSVARRSGGVCRYSSRSEIERLLRWPGGLDETPCISEDRALLHPFRRGNLRRSRIARQRRI